MIAGEGYSLYHQGTEFKGESSSLLILSLQCRGFELMMIVGEGWAIPSYHTEFKGDSSGLLILSL
jgi:hypothetical protein